MKQINLQTINDNLLNLENRIDDKITSLEEKIGNRFTGLEDKIDSVKTGLENKIDSVKTGLEDKIEDLALHTKLSFDQSEERFNKLENLVYLNADAIAKLTQKSDIEFAAATIQRQRGFNKLNSHENRIVRLESHHIPA